MKDQAAQLRELTVENSHPVSSPQGNGKIHLVASGKGGVGKSVFALALAGAWARLGLRVLVVDADLISPSLHVLTGFDAPMTVETLLKYGLGRTRLEQWQLSPGLWLLPGNHARGQQDGDTLADVHFFAEQLDKLAPHFDRIVIDTHTGASRWNLGLFQYADWIYLLTLVEPTSVIDSYLFVKAVRPYLDIRKLNLVVNQSLSDESAREAHQNLNLALNHFLKTQIHLLGSLPFDAELREALVAQRPFWRDGLETAALNEIRNLAIKLAGGDQDTVEDIPKNREVLP